MSVYRVPKDEAIDDAVRRAVDRRLDGVVDIHDCTPYSSTVWESMGVPSWQPVGSGVCREAVTGLWIEA